MNSRQAIDQLSEDEKAGKEPSKIDIVRLNCNATSVCRAVMKLYAQSGVDLHTICKCTAGVDELDNLVEQMGDLVHRMASYFAQRHEVPEHLKNVATVLVGVNGPPGSKMQFTTDHWYLMTEANFDVLARRIARHNAKLDLQP